MQNKLRLSFAKICVVVSAQPEPTTLVNPERSNNRSDTMNPIDLLESTESNRNQPCFNVILTHDNEVAAAGARFSVGRLLAAIPSNDLHHDQWSFSELGHAEFRRE